MTPITVVVYDWDWQLLGYRHLTVANNVTDPAMGAARQAINEGVAREVARRLGGVADLHVGMILGHADEQGLRDAPAKQGLPERKPDCVSWRPPIAAQGRAN